MGSFDCPSSTLTPPRRTPSGVRSATPFGPRELVRRPSGTLREGETAETGAPSRCPCRRAGAAGFVYSREKAQDDNGGHRRSVYMGGEGGGGSETASIARIGGYGAGQTFFATSNSSIDRCSILSSSHVSYFCSSRLRASALCLRIFGFFSGQRAFETEGFSLSVRRVRFPIVSSRWSRSAMAITGSPAGGDQCWRQP